MARLSPGISTRTETRNTVWTRVFSGVWVFSSPPVERRARDHTRAIHRLSYSTIVHYYCLSGSADGDVRIWVSRCRDTLWATLSERVQDLRDMSKSVLKIHH